MNRVRFSGTSTARWSTPAIITGAPGATRSPPKGSRSHTSSSSTASGNATIGSLPAWLGSDASPARITRIGDAKEALYREFARREGLVALPGAVQWVQRLHENGWRQAIASSAPRANVQVMVDAVGIAGYFEALVAAEDVTIGKPDPQVFLAAAARLGVSPGRCVVVEDAAAGIEAARAGGMRSIGVSASATLPADVSVRSLADLSSDAFDRLLG